jgi:hypothetical protein
MSNLTANDTALDIQINRFGFWCAVICIATGLLSAALPLDVQGGYDAWLNQIVAMLTLSGLFLAITWRVRHKSPLSALLAAGATALATMAFVIPKFMAVWTIPLLAEATLSGTAGSEMAAMLLPLLNVSIPFSLYTSFDYMGFWLYSLFALLVMVPMVDRDWLSKFAALSLGLFGVGFHVAFAMLIFGVIGAPDIEVSFGLTFIPLLLLILVMVAIFRRVN